MAVLVYLLEAVKQITKLPQRKESEQTVKLALKHFNGLFDIDRLTSLRNLVKRSNNFVHIFYGDFVMFRRIQLKIEPTTFRTRKLRLLHS